MPYRALSAAIVLLCCWKAASSQSPSIPGRFLVVSDSATSAEAPQAAPPLNLVQLPPEHQCPGLFPSDLTRQNCEYGQRQRTVDWISTSFTDRAILTAAASGFGSFIVRSPNEWPRTSLGFADRWRASYFSGMGNGTAQFVLNSAFNLDPRHVSCAVDELIRERRSGTLDPEIEPTCSPAHRVLHVLEDTLVTRKSSNDGLTKLRWPSPRLVGGFAGAYSEAPWQPEAENTPTAILTRAGESLVVPLIGSIFNEFPTVLNGITKPFHKSKPLPKRPSEVPQ